jgi:cleavage stimulation factor subunit 3
MVFRLFICFYFCISSSATILFQVAQSVFEAGLKRFMHEPGYILEYADFLCRLNDDRNVRALFERALSLLPPEESIEVEFLFHSLAKGSQN